MRQIAPGMEADQKSHDKGQAESETQQPDPDPVLRSDQ